MLSRHIRLTSRLKKYFCSAFDYNQIASVNNIKNQKIKNSFDLNNLRTDNIKFLNEDLELDIYEIKKIKNRNPELFFNFNENNIGKYIYKCINSQI